MRSAPLILTWPQWNFVLKHFATEDEAREYTDRAARGMGFDGFSIMSKHYRMRA